MFATSCGVRLSCSALSINDRPSLCGRPEIFSAGIISVGKRYLEAGTSLGLSRTQTAFSITLPIMFRTVLPSLGNTFIGLFKDTSIAVAIAAPELTWAAR